MSKKSVQNGKTRSLETNNPYHINGDEKKIEPKNVNADQEKFDKEKQNIHSLDNKNFNHSQNSDEKDNVENIDKWKKKLWSLRVKKRQNHPSPKIKLVQDLVEKGEEKSNAKRKWDMIRNISSDSRSSPLFPRDMREEIFLRTLEEEMLKVQNSVKTLTPSPSRDRTPDSFERSIPRPPAPPVVYKLRRKLRKYHERIQSMHDMKTRNKSVYEKKKFYLHKKRKEILGEVKKIKKVEERKKRNPKYYVKNTFKQHAPSSTVILKCGKSHLSLSYLYVFASFGQFLFWVIMLVYKIFFFTFVNVWSVSFSRFITLFIMLFLSICSVIIGMTGSIISTIGGCIYRGLRYPKRNRIGSIELSIMSGITTLMSLILLYIVFFMMYIVIIDGIIYGIVDVIWMYMHVGMTVLLLVVLLYFCVVFDVVCMRLAWDEKDFDPIDPVNEKSLEYSSDESDSSWDKIFNGK